MSAMPRWADIVSSDSNSFANSSSILRGMNNCILNEDSTYRIPLPTHSFASKSFAASCVFSAENCKLLRDLENSRSGINVKLNKINVSVADDCNKEGKDHEEKGSFENGKNTSETKTTDLNFGEIATSFSGILQKQREGNKVSNDGGGAAKENEQLFSISSNLSNHSKKNGSSVITSNNSNSSMAISCSSAASSSLLSDTKFDNNETNHSNASSLSFSSNSLPSDNSFSAAIQSSACVPSHVAASNNAKAKISKNVLLVDTITDWRRASNNFSSAEVNDNHNKNKRNHVMNMRSNNPNLAPDKYFAGFGDKEKTLTPAKRRHHLSYERRETIRKKPNDSKGNEDKKEDKSVEITGFEAEKCYVTKKKRLSSSNLSIKPEKQKTENAGTFGEEEHTEKNLPLNFSEIFVKNSAVGSSNSRRMSSSKKEKRVNGGLVEASGGAFLGGNFNNNNKGGFLDVTLAINNQSGNFKNCVFSTCTAEKDEREVTINKTMFNNNNNATVLQTITKSNKSINHSLSNANSVNVFNINDNLNAFNTNKENETDEWNRRIKGRLKDIAIGKATKGYKNYIRKIPKEKRIFDNPNTPDPKMKASKAKFHNELILWRKSLHNFDDISLPPEEHKAAKHGTIEGFEDLEGMEDFADLNHF